MSNSSQPSWNNAVLKDNQKINSGVWAHHCHSTAHFWSTDHYFSIRHRSGVSPLKPKEQKAKNKTYSKAPAPSLTQCMPQATGTAAFMGWPSTGCLVLKSHHQKPSRSPPVLHKSSCCHPSHHPGARQKPGEQSAQRAGVPQTWPGSRRLCLTGFVPCLCCIFTEKHRK